MIKAIIFDFDGVIGDTEHINFEAAKEAFSRHGVTLTKQQFMDVWVNRKGVRDQEKAADAFGRIYHHPVDITEVRRIRAEIYKEYYDGGLSLIPGAKEKIEEFHSHFPLAVVSSAYQLQIEHTLSKFGLRDYFKFIISSEDVQHHKPNPEPYQKAMERLKIKKGEGVVVEDTMVGVQSAHGAGLKVIALPNEYTFQGDFTQADFVADSFTEITLDLLQKL